MTSLLAAAIMVPLAFALAIPFLPERRARSIALLGTLISLAIAVGACFTFSWEFGENFQPGPEAGIEWVPRLGLSLRLGVDSVSLLLVCLTALLGPICVLASFSAITTRVRTYYAWLLVLQAAMTGVFCSRDLILFYICFEFTLVPMFVLISLWGSTNRKKAAVKFFLYTFTGSVIALAGLVYIAYVNAAAPANIATGAGVWTWDIETLGRAARAMTLRQQSWVMLALLSGFAVKVPLFPLHTWLPLAHTEAPTAGSVILAGVLLKLGTYGIYRFVLPFVPDAVAAHAPLLATVCIVGILYGGLICWVQVDVKKLVAYSSVAHLGFCMLGMFALNNTGLSGSVLYMINHGLSTGALFLLIGMVYERYHTRSMKELGGLAARMPVWATFMVFFTMASVGLPGLNGFVSEFLCLLGAFQSSTAWGSGLWGTLGTVPGKTAGGLGPWYAAVAGVGMIIAAMYLLYMVGKVVWGPLVVPHHDHQEPHAERGGTQAALPRDLNAREIGILVPLAVLCIAMGVYPKPILNAIQGPINTTLAVYDAVYDKRPVKPAVVAPAPHAAAHQPGEATP